MLQYQGSKLYRTSSPIPPNGKQVCEACLRLFDRKELHKRTGLSPTAARKLVRSFFDQYDRPSVLYLPLRFDELTAIHALLTTIPIYPVFNDETLFTEFRETLIYNKWLEPKERTQFEKLRSAVGLFAIAMLHNSEIDLGGGERAFLEIAPNLDMLAIHARMRMYRPINGPIWILRNVYVTSLDRKTHCSAELQSDGGWDGIVELTDRGILAKLS